MMNVGGNLLVLGVVAAGHLEHVSSIYQLGQMLKLGRRYCFVLASTATTKTKSNRSLRVGFEVVVSLVARFYWLG